MNQAVEIFAHGIVVTQAPDAEEVYVVSGKGWEGEPFKLFLTEDEAKSLHLEMGFLLYES